MLHVYHNPHCKLEEPNRVTILKQILKSRSLPSYEFDMYQFGVPTHMKYIAQEIRNYSTYWGFDSFLGLPDEMKSRYKNPLWGKGSFAMASNQFDVSNQIRQLKKELDVKSTKTRLVSGFYNESLSGKIAIKAKPAFFVDINCDLYISTKQALRWLFEHNLVRKNTLILYDDWQNTPFGEGESLAHMQISNEFLVEFELAWHEWSNCHLVVFGIKSIGFRSDYGIPTFLQKYNVWN
tara:strand:+ start:867 stop:1574 length:708 start_codon:yes stop_codon:yes gene_type:complete